MTTRTVRKKHCFCIYHHLKFRTKFAKHMKIKQQFNSGIKPWPIGNVFVLSWERCKVQISLPELGVCSALMQQSFATNQSNKGVTGKTKKQLFTRRLMQQSFVTDQSNKGVTGKTKKQLFTQREISRKDKDVMRKRLNEEEIQSTLLIHQKIWKTEADRKSTKNRQFSPKFELNAKENRL